MAAFTTFNSESAEIIGTVARVNAPRVMPDGKAWVIDFSVPVQKPGRKNEDGTWTNETKWWKVVVWYNERDGAKNTVETISQRIAKGTFVVVQGEAAAEAYIDKNGKAVAVNVMKPSKIIWKMTKNNDELRDAEDSLTFSNPEWGTESDNDQPGSDQGSIFD